MFRSLLVFALVLCSLFLLMPAPADAHWHHGLSFVEVRTGLGGHVNAFIPTNDIFDPPFTSSSSSYSATYYGSGGAFSNPFFAGQLYSNPSVTFQLDAIRQRNAVNAAILAAELDRHRPRPATTIIIRP